MPRLGRLIGVLVCRTCVFAILLFPGVAVSQSPSAGQAQVHTEMIEVLEAYAVHKMGQFDKAFEAWMALAEKGNAQGILNVANLYQEGRGVEESPVKAVQWYRKGAQQGDPHCLYNLARAYETGRGVLVDEASAGTYYQLAADAGSTDAQLVVARSLLDEDKPEDARYWLERAADGGHQDAVQLLARLEPPTEPDEGAKIPVQQQRRVVRFLDDLDAAANARDADLLTRAIDEDTDILVRLPGQSAPQRMTKAEYRALWIATFQKTERYRFIRAKFDKSASRDGLRVRSDIREYLTSKDRTQVLLLSEDLMVDLKGETPRVTKIVLKVDRP